MSLLGVSFVLQQVFHQGARAGLLGTNALAAAAMGGLEPSRTGWAEAWRLATYALLHADLFHVLFNALSLALAGFVVEQTLGRSWTLCLFVCGVLGGGGAAVLAGGHAVVIGASGGVLALAGAALLCTSRFPAVALRSRLRLALALLTAPAVVPMLVGAGTNVAGHIGGLLAGVLVGALALALTPRDHSARAGAQSSAQSLAQWFARAVVAVGVAWMLWGLTQLPASYAAGMVEAQWADGLAPEETVNALHTQSLVIGGDGFAEALDAALAQWPTDPRLHHLRGHHALGRHRVQDAMASAATGLSSPLLGSRAFSNGELEASLRVLRVTAALEAGDAPSVPPELEALCGPLLQTSGGQWAASNALCDDATAGL